MSLAYYLIRQCGTSRHTRHIYMSKSNIIFSVRKRAIFFICVSPQICIQTWKTPFLFIIHTPVHNLDYSVSRRHHDATWLEYNTMAHLHDINRENSGDDPPTCCFVTAKDKRHWPQPQRSLPPSLPLTCLFIKT